MLTKFVRLYPTRTTGTGEAISSQRHYFRSEFLISDRGSSFTSCDFRAFVGDNNVCYVKVAIASPQATGQLESDLGTNDCETLGFGEGHSLGQCHGDCRVLHQ